MNLNVLDGGIGHQLKFHFWMGNDPLVDEILILQKQLDPGN